MTDIDDKKRTLKQIAADVRTQARFMIRVADAEKWPASDLTRTLADDASWLASCVLRGDYIEEDDDD